MHPSVSGHPAANHKIYHAAVNATKAAAFSAKGNVWAIEVQNNTASAVYLQLFDLASGSVTVGTTTADYSLMVPASGIVALDKVHFPIRYCANACTIAVTTTRTGNTSPATAATVTIHYDLE